MGENVTVGFAVSDYNGEKPKDNQKKFQLGDLEVWMSYQAVIGFRVGRGPLFICQNRWTSTTGKHIGLMKKSLGWDQGNWVELPGENFDQLLASLVEKVNAALMPSGERFIGDPGKNSGRHKH